MPKVKIDDKTSLYYELEHFVEPWRQPETILLIHGIGGTTEEWFAWVPPLSGKYAVLRVDLRGWGKSTVPPAGYTWSMDNYAADLVALMDKLGLKKVHMVGTKLGGRIAIHFAHAFPDRLHSLTLICTPMSLQTLPNDSRDRRPSTVGGKKGVARWARNTMEERLGKVAPAGKVSPEMMEWWIELYSKASPRVVSEIFDLAWWTEEFSLLPGIKAPTLVIDSNAQLDIEQIRKWQTIIADSELSIIPITTEGRQISASKPAECVSALLGYLDKLSKRRPS